MEIIIDLPIGIPINNIISARHKRMGGFSPFQLRHISRNPTSATPSLQHHQGFVHAMLGLYIYTCLPMSTGLIDVAFITSQEIVTLVALLEALCAQM